MKLSSVSTLGFVIARHLYQQALRSAANTGELRVEDMEVEESNSATKRNGKHELLSGSIEKIGLLHPDMKDLASQFYDEVFHSCCQMVMLLRQLNVAITKPFAFFEEFQESSLLVEKKNCSLFFS